MGLGGTQRQGCLWPQSIRNLRGNLTESPVKRRAVPHAFGVPDAFEARPLAQERIPPERTCPHHWEGLKTVLVRPSSRKVLQSEKLSSWLSHSLLYRDALPCQLLEQCICQVTGVPRGPRRTALGLSFLHKEPYSGGLNTEVIFS